MKSPSLSGVPVADGEMSMTGSPSRLSEPMDARDSVVTRGFISFLSAQRDLDGRPGEFDRRDLADLDAGDADDRAALEALDVVEAGLQVVPIPEEPALSADGDDDQRGQRQRGDRKDSDFQFRPGQRPCAWHTTCPSSFYDKNALDVRIVRGNLAQLVGVPFEPDPAVLQHDEFRLVGLLPVGPREFRPGATAQRGVLGDVERVAQLVRDQHRADPFQVAQLDDLLVDRRRR